MTTNKTPRTELAKQVALAMACTYWRGQVPKRHDELSEDYEAMIKRNARADIDRFIDSASMQISFVLDLCKPLEWKE